MSESRDIPLLTDLIQTGPEVTMSDLGLDNDPAVDAGVKQPADSMTFDLDQGAADTTGAFNTPDIELSPGAHDQFDINPALEQAVRRILDEHMELAWQEIKLAIQQHQNRS